MRKLYEVKELNHSSEEEDNDDHSSNFRAYTEQEPIS